jgi:hypothetical protein
MARENYKINLGVLSILQNDLNTFFVRPTENVDITLLEKF